MDTLSARRLPADITVLQSLVDCNEHVYRIQNISSPSMIIERTSGSPVSPISSTGPICRICHEGDAKEELTSPCRCTGTMKLVHQSCLEKWLSSSNSDTCEICKFKYIIYRQPRPVSEWLQRRSDPNQCRNLMGDLLCFLLLTPLAAVSAYLCFMGATHYSAWKIKWESSGLICLSVFLISLYVTWCFITIKYYVSSWREWRATNQNVYLIEMRQLFPSPRWPRYARPPSTVHRPIIQQRCESPNFERQLAVRTVSDTPGAFAISSPPSSSTTVCDLSDLETTVSMEAQGLYEQRGTPSSSTSMSFDRSSPMSNCARWWPHRHCQQSPLLAEEGTGDDDMNETEVVSTML